MSVQPPAAAAKEKEKAPREVCKFFSAGGCKHGDDCKFAHVTPPAPCKFYALGSCTKGAECKFSHDGVVSGGVAAATPAAAAPASTSMFRPMAGALVEFTDGAAVEDVLFPSDYTAVRIVDVPKAITNVAATLRQMARKHGFTVAADDVHAFPDAEPPYVTVRSRDAGFAKAACADGWRWPRDGGPVRATLTDAPMPAAFAAKRFDSRKVCVTWPNWARSATGVDEQMRSATNVNRRLSDEALDKLARASWRKEGAGRCVRELLAEVGPLESLPDDGEVKVEPTEDGRRTRMTVRFLDADDAHRAADEFHLAPQPAPPGAAKGTSRRAFTAEVVHAAKFKASTDVYRVEERRILTLARQWLVDDDVRFFAYPSTDPQRRFRVLKVESAKTDAVQKASAALEDVLAGALANDTGDGGDDDESDEPLWDEALRTSGALHRQISAAVAAHGAAVQCNKLRCEIRVFGSDRQRAAAITALRALLKDTKRDRGALAEHVVELVGADARWALAGGARAVLAALGPEKVRFEMGLHARRAIVRGTPADVAAVQKMIRERRTTNNPKRHSSKRAGKQRAATPSPDDDDDDDECCPVCMCPPDTPVRTPCGHVYCADCLESSCTLAQPSASPSAPGLRIECLGLAHRCETPLPLAFIQDHLSAATFASVLERSFSSYVQRNLARLRYCPHPRCGHVLRLVPEQDAAPARCANCLGVRCSGCATANGHDAFSCADWRAAQAGTDLATRNLELRLGVKMCPCCGIRIEKIDGCNHVMCTACGTHMCWVCLRTFPHGRDVYGHMHEAHAGFYTADIVSGPQRGIEARVAVRSRPSVTPPMRFFG
jgi:hypothetical protein